jgi:outer membrane receptor protein involved in Fe transport
MTRRSGGRLLGAILVVGLGVGLARAQSTTATLTGTVHTPDGAPAPGAVVEARSEALGASRGAITDKDGHYRIDLLPPGTWVVQAHLSDGPAGEPRTVVLTLQQTALLDLVLGTTLTETVTVRADSERIDPAKTGWDLRVSGAQVNDLPIHGRVVTDLALLDSTIKRSAPGNFYGERGDVFVVNGQSGRANSFLVDGLDNNDAISNTSLDSFFSQQVIKEFVVLTSQYAPEFGRASGGILNIITERGTNDESGSLFLEGAPSALASPGDFVSSLPQGEGTENTGSTFRGGIKMGGPIRRDRAFYFASYEHQGSNDVVPYTGVARDGVAGGVMNAPQQSDNLFFRTDFNLGESNFLMTRLSWDDRSSSGLNVGGISTPESGFELQERKTQFASGLTTVVSPTVLNEVRFLATTGSFDQQANSSLSGVERPSGVFGGNNLNRQERNEDRLQLVENFTWQAGRHALKFGVDVTRSDTDIHTWFNPNGNFLYDTDRPFEPGDQGDLDTTDPSTDPDPRCNDPNNPDYATYAPWCPRQHPPDPNGIDDDGDGVIDEPGYLGTYPVVFQLISGAPSARLKDTRYAVFGQDAWEVNEKLVLTYGLRYDLSTYRLPSDAVVPSSIPNGDAPIDRNNIAPRFGFTWRPTASGKFLVRGGGGMFYDKLVLGFPAVAAITSGTQIGLVFPQGLGFEITENVVAQMGIDAIKEVLLFPQNLILRFSTGTTLDTPYTVQWSLGAEAAVGDTMSVRAGATRALGYHQTLMRDLNPPVSKDFNGMPIHPDDSVGSIAAFVSEGRSWYSALDLGWRRRGQSGWMDVSYTLSKALDLGPDPLKGGIYLPPNTGPALQVGTVLPPGSYSLENEKGRSDSDQRHRLVVAGASRLPWGSVWLSGQMQLASGLPFNVTTGRDDNLDGITSDRPQGVGRNTGASTDLDVVNAIRTNPTVGLPPVDSLKEPVFWQIDLRVWKPFAYKGGDKTGNVYLQVFNLLDRFNAGLIEGRVTARNFGQPITQLGPPRTVEFGVMLGF